jgi:hypothetical protein
MLMVKPQAPRFAKLLRLITAFYAFAQNLSQVAAGAGVGGADFMYACIASAMRCATLPTASV